MSATNALESKILSLMFENADATLIGDAGGLRGSVAAGSYYISLHTADPGEAGAQNTSEATYTGYARVAIARSTAAWTVTGNTADNDAAINFAACTGGSNVITYFGIGSDSGTGAGNLWFRGALTSSLTVSNGITPSFAAGALDVTAD